MKQQRLIPLTGAGNFRDLGGYQSQEKRKVAWGKIYRADSLSNLTPADLEELKKRHVTVDCDLRTAFEQRAMPDKLTEEIRYVDCHVYAEEGDTDQQADVPGEILQTGYLGSIYQHILLNVHSQHAFGAVMQHLINLPAKEALVFHCSAGKDRTGMMAALILKTLGVDDQTIIKDYLLTNQLYDFASSRQLPSEEQLGQMVAKMNTTKGDAPVMKGFLQTLEQGWGTIDNFWQQQLGFSSEQLNSFRQKYLQPK